MAGRSVPRTLAREGLAMRNALVSDLAAIRDHEIVMTTDPRFASMLPRRVETVTIAAGRAALLDSLVASADAVWLVAPETNRCLEQLATRVERKQKMLHAPLRDMPRHSTQYSTI